MPTRRLPLTIADGELVPAWLGDRDRPWLRDLLDEAASYIGRPIRELLSRWRRSDIDPRAGVRQAPAVHTLARWLRRSADGTSRSDARLQLFRLHASGTSKDQALERIATQHGLAPAELAASLFADLPDNRIVRWPQPAPEPTRLALAANTGMVQDLLAHAHSIELVLQGASRTILRTAWLHGAGLQIIDHRDGSATCRWRRDTSAVSARTIARLAPLLPWTHRYRLTAECQLRAPAQRGRFVLCTGDPILPAPEPRQYDSQLERAFARDFARSRPDWLLQREPAPLSTSHGLAFPDFALCPPDRDHTWLCEVTGLRTASSLPAKLALLEHPRLVLCLPERSVPDSYREHDRIVPFRRRVPIERVLGIVDRR